MQHIPDDFYTEARKRLVNWVSRQLIGPPEATEATEGGHFLNVDPITRFPCGALYPAIDDGEGLDAVSEDPAPPVESNEDEISAEPTVNQRRFTPPSSLGFSFFISGSDIKLQILCAAVSYSRRNAGSGGRSRDAAGRFSNEWIRHKLVPDGDDEEFVEASPAGGRLQQSQVLGGRARVDILWRQSEAGWIMTVSLSNLQQLPSAQEGPGEFRIDQVEGTLFEARLRCVVDSGEIAPYPHADRSLLDAEEQETELQYRHHQIYAVGHGCAVDWVLDGDHVKELRSTTLPVVEVPQITADGGEVADLPALSIARLSTLAESHNAQIAELSEFTDRYEHWVDERAASLETLDPCDRGAGKRIVERMQVALQRMRAGLQLLATSEKARTAFAIANRAMLDQMQQGDRVRKKQRAEQDYRWRPFQLAFLLATLESTENVDSQYRDTVDLIWFPTGGGKTEAYLGLIAFQVALRRIRYPDSGGGTSVLMRYTLRLLTRDQYLRATRLILALELLRRDDPALLGQEPISIGLWVGQATSPNTFRDAAKIVEALSEGQRSTALVLERCPWCSTPFDSKDNFRSSAQRFHFFCRNRDCAFGNDADTPLPCNIVDQALYAEPPTLLLATIDKFAQLAWKGEASAFFGANGARPPELIIQDELHLIAGALGSVAGVYEAAIDSVLQLRGVFPKYIASTATIRMATQQVRRLYGRDVAVFPPPGLSSDDSWFARTVPLSTRPGRMYVGYLATMLNRQRCMAPLAAALLLAPAVLFENDSNRDALLDAWWTLVAYHGSLRGVSNSATALETDVQEFMRLLLSEEQRNTTSDDRPQQLKQRRNVSSVEQLTSLQSADENAAIFGRLSVPRGEAECLDAVLATNMISVGLDVERIALMIVNGQPLTTAEYIQASSRVGRGQIPGLVFMNYYRDQARSLSHYEDFRAYHESFYRFVEPTSVTPFTHQARLRALHAAVVIVMRHGRTGLNGNETAGRFDPEMELVRRAVETLKQRCRMADPDAAEAIAAHIDVIVTAWHEETLRCDGARRNLHYQVSDANRACDRLLYNHDDRNEGLWPTLQSMRNVEHTALLKAL